MPALCHVYPWPWLAVAGAVRAAVAVPVRGQRWPESWPQPVAGPVLVAVAGGANPAAGGEPVPAGAGAGKAQAPAPRSAVP